MYIHIYIYIYIIVIHGDKAPIVEDMKKVPLLFSVDDGDLRTFERAEEMWQPLH